MSHGGVSVGAISHKCERYESEWSKCGKKRKESMWIVTVMILIAHLRGWLKKNLCHWCKASGVRKYEGYTMSTLFSGRGLPQLHHKGWCTPMRLSGSHVLTNAGILLGSVWATAWRISCNVPSRSQQGYGQPPSPGPSPKWSDVDNETGDWFCRMPTDMPRTQQRSMEPEI